jgi:hypothetical protein
VSYNSSAIKIYIANSLVRFENKNIFLYILLKHYILLQHCRLMTQSYDRELQLQRCKNLQRSILPQHFRLMTQSYDRELQIQHCKNLQRSILHTRTLYINSEVHFKALICV